MSVAVDLGQGRPGEFEPDKVQYSTPKLFVLKHKI